VSDFSDYEEKLPSKMTLEEIREAALIRYKAFFQSHTDQQAVRALVAELAGRRRDWQTRSELQQWVEENFGDPGPPRFTDTEIEEIRDAYRKALVHHAMRHAEFIAAQHAQDIADQAIPPLSDV
jgi:hypothetical protein